MLSISPRARDVLVVFCTVVFVLTFAYMLITERPIPDDFRGIILLVGGFFFGLPLQTSEKPLQSGTVAQSDARANTHRPSHLDV